MTKSELWILSEWRVALDRVQRCGEKLLAHRERTPYAEIDLLTEAPSGDWHLIEVKTWRKSLFGDLWGPSLLTVRQRERLDRARLYLESRKTSPGLVRLMVAVVHPDSTFRHGSLRYFDELTEFPGRRTL